MSLSLPNWLRAREGPLTDQLKRAAAPFGLGQVPADVVPVGVARSVCGFCSTGCVLDLHLDAQGTAIGLTPTADAPVNRGTACPKGWEALAVLDAPDRATVPLLRGPDGRRRAVSWDEAMDVFVSRFRRVFAEHGPDSVAFVSTGQIATEEMAFLGALAKFGMGIKHGDGNTRQCMATAVTAYKESFGFDAPPYCYEDLEESDVLVFVGSNLCVTHPVLWGRVARGPRRPEVVVVDPRKTETAEQASLHLAIAPKSDLVLFYGLAHLLIEMGRVDHEFVAAHTTGFEEFAAFVGDYPPALVSQATGVSESALRGLAEKLGPGRRTSFWWTMGVNQGHQATRTAQAIINLALMTGAIGRPGTGANSITGQCNAMGSRLFSNTTNLLGGRDFARADHRQEVADVLGLPVERVPSVGSWAYPEIVDGIKTGKIKGLWVVATNPAHSWVDNGALGAALKGLDFFVVQDMYASTETALAADLVLPAAGWGEKAGTFINSERRIGTIKKARRAPGQALADFAIFRLVAERWGVGEMFHDWTSPAAVFEKLKALSAGRPCDFSGLGQYEDLDELGGVQWPFRPGDKEATPRLFADGRFFRPDGRARFVYEAPTAVEEAPDSSWPLWLLTGRGTAAQWHTQTRTAKSEVLRRLAPGALALEIGPEDAHALGIESGDALAVESRRGTVHARALVASTVAKGQVFLPMHDASVNALTLSSFDPHSRQPAYKSCAVRVRKSPPPPRPAFDRS